MDRFIARTIEKRSIQRGGLPSQWYQAGPSIVRERHLFDKGHDDKEKSEKSETEASDNNDNNEKKKKKKDDKKDDKKSNNDPQGPCWDGFHRDKNKPVYSKDSCVAN